MDLQQAVFVLSFISVSSGARHNVGTEFIVGFLNNQQSGSTLDLEIFVTTASNTPANVTVTAPLFDVVIRDTVVTRGTTSKLTLPAGLRGSGSAKSNKGVLIESTEEITVYCVNKETYSTDAFVALPVQALGYRYYVMTYQTDAEMMLVGTQDGTDIHIMLPSPSLQSIAITFEGVNYIDGDVLKLQVNKYETVHLHQAAANADFTGTFIDANKPVAVFSGNKNIPVPAAAGSSDHVVEQMTPVSSWGKDFIFVSTPDRTTGDIIRILASEDATIVTISGIGSITISFAGKFIELAIPSSEVKFISSFKPVMVAVFSKTDPGSEVNGGDPSMYLLTPISQYASNYVFSTVETPSGNFTNYLTVVIEGSKTPGLRLDTSGVDSLGVTWVSVPDSSGLVAGSVGISPGSHNVYHENPTVVFLGLCTGVAPYNSYAFVSGTRLARINEPCTPTGTMPGDVVDNDCDGLIDEEENNGIDDDSDGAVDEDLSFSRRVDGGFSAWSPWTSCTVTCGGNGTVTRNRNCNKPAPSHDGLPCSGSLSETDSCLPVVTDCPIDGAWTTWSSWSTCSVTCDSGNQTRSRTCSNPAPKYNGTACMGDAEEAVACFSGVPCPVDGNWSTWSPWNMCSVTCGSGSRGRSRSCENPAPAYNGTDCPGQGNETESCITGVKCPIDGGFNLWTSWGPCPVTCDNGTQFRTRDCSNPAPQFGGNNCTGDVIETMTCNTGIRCPLPGGWGDWVTWSACSLTCGRGHRVRNRPCNNPVPEPGGDCPGVAIELETCNIQVCEVHHSNRTCAYMWFPCRDGSACIHFLNRCNCAFDCSDGSDEDVTYARCVRDIDKCVKQDSSAPCSVGSYVSVVLISVLCLLCTVSVR